jgi:uncharacterized glyoxalase superfamily protein PhnB
VIIKEKLQNTDDTEVTDSHGFSIFALSVQIRLIRAIRVQKNDKVILQEVTMATSPLLNGKLLLLLYVKDVEQSVYFYRDKLSFLFKGWWDNNQHDYVPEWTHAEKPSFAELKAGDLVIHLHIDMEGEAAKTGATIFHIEVADVDQYHQEVTARGLKVEAPQEMPWGWRQFYVTDPDGHRWSFRNPTTAGIAA